MTRKLWLRACLALACVVGTVLAGEPSGKENFVIGYSISNFNNAYQTYVYDGAKEYADKSGVLSVNVSDAQDDVVKQIDQVKSLIEQGVDGLIVVPVDTAAMAPVTQAAVEANIPLCYVNRNPYAGAEDTMPANVYYVGSEEIVAGRMQMEYAAELLGGKGNIAILMGQLGNEGAVKRLEGAEEVIAAKYPDIKILASETGNWQRDEGMTVTENFLTAYGEDLDAILAQCDDMAIGALNACKNSGRDDIIILGIDAIPDMLQLIQAGELPGTILQDAVGQGAMGAEMLHKIFTGEKVDQVVWIPFVLVTQANVDEHYSK